ncbi:MAG TPA: Spy/CpxP family protein refolding chaperone [Gemmatimonadaceae bacterium]|nr:Spy/CpxP family protein refolding chaperone [Gemmatimonadaceae bacterium]
MTRPIVSNTRVLLAAAMLILPLAAGELQAQRVPPPPGGGRGRAQLEQRFRERFEGVLKERLALSDEQLQQMRAVNARLDGKRRELFAEERDVRRAMRDALQGPEDPATQERVAQLMERALRVQRARLDLLESEQRELAAFLTPVQRARFLGLQEQLRRRAEEMRRRAEGDTLDDAMPGGPPGGRRMRPPLRRPGA